MNKLKTLELQSPGPCLPHTRHVTTKTQRSLPQALLANALPFPSGGCPSAHPAGVSRCAEAVGPRDASLQSSGPGRVTATHSQLHPQRSEACRNRQPGPHAREGASSPAKVPDGAAVVNVSPGQLAGPVRAEPGPRLGPGARPVTGSPRSQRCRVCRARGLPRSRCAAPSFRRAEIHRMMSPTRDASSCRQGPRARGGGGGTAAGRRPLGVNTPPVPPPWAPRHLQRPRLDSPAARDRQRNTAVCSQSRTPGLAGGPAAQTPPRGPEREPRLLPGTPRGLRKAGVGLSRRSPGGQCGRVPTGGLGHRCWPGPPLRAPARM